MSKNPLADKLQEQEEIMNTYDDKRLECEDVIKAIDSFCLECPLSNTKDCIFCYLNPYSPYKSGGNINA
jgi:hypothetical protein